MTARPTTTLFGLPVQIMDGLRDDTIIVGKVTVLLDRAGRPFDAVIDGGVIKLGERDAQG